MCHAGKDEGKQGLLLRAELKVTKITSKLLGVIVRA